MRWQAPREGRFLRWAGRQFGSCYEFIMRPLPHVALAAAASALLIVALSACSPVASTAPVETKASEPVPAATPSATPTPTPTPTSEKSTRGNFIKSVGVPFGFGEGDARAEFTVNGITLDPACTAEYAEQPENGRFVKVDISGRTGQIEEQVFFGIGAWKVIADNGTTYNGDPQSSAAWMCLNDAERFPDAVGPGEQVTGSIIFDVPTPSGTLMFQPYGPGNGGWEWAYPAS